MIKARVTEGSPAVFFHSSFYTRLIEEASGRKLKLTRDRREVELELGLYTPTISYKAAQSIDSVLGRKIGRRVTYAQVTRRQWRGRLHRTVPRVWFTGENVRPPSDGWDLTLTFDLDNLNGTNEYCPLWWGEINLIPGVKSASRERVGREMTVEEFLTPRFINLDERPGFVCAFVNNPEPMRLHAVRMLRRLGPVHVYGRVAGRPTGPKIDIAR